MGFPSLAQTPTNRSARQRATRERQEFLMDRPLMPKATAVWLVDNTGLTFEQIAEFCGLHPLEVQGIADGEVGAGIRGLDPVAGGQLTREEIERCQKDPKARLQLARPAAAALKPARRKEPRYTPLSKRQDRPDAIAWLLRHHPELSDQQICKLLGTTKATVNAVRERTHWKSAEIRPRDPVLIGLCSQLDLDAAVIEARAAQRERESRELAAAEAALAALDRDQA
jgi:hypothetical protein